MLCVTLEQGTDMYLKPAASLLFKERESLNSNIVDSINQASDEWGIRCLRYEIKDIQVPPRVKESMQMQVRHTCDCNGHLNSINCKGYENCSPQPPGDL